VETCADASGNTQQRIVNKVKTVADHANTAEKAEAEEAEWQRGFSRVADDVIDQAGKKQVSQRNSKNADAVPRVIGARNREESNKEDSREQASVVKNVVNRRQRRLA
jgi:ABC-type hemin transport system substrate-binding protein